MPNGHNFEHLPLVFRESGRARLTGGGSPAARTVENKTTNRVAHSAAMLSEASSVVAQHQVRSEVRTRESLPSLPPGIPLLLEIDPGLDIDDLRHHLKFEIVSEEEQGFVIVASDDINLAEFLAAANGFASRASGSATVASIHRLDDDPDQSQRVNLILSESLVSVWLAIEQIAMLQVEIGITCLGTHEIPSEPVRRKRESDQELAERKKEWADAKVQAYEGWLDLQDKRVDEVRRIIEEGYGGRIADIFYDNAGDVASLPDSFTMRVTVSGRGLKDFVLNFPFVFEVTEPENVTLTRHVAPVGVNTEALLDLQPPDKDAPAVCVIDSGIEEGHRFLEPAIDKATSYCYLPHPVVSTDVVDRVPPSGHGTRVAGAVLYGEHVQRPQSFQLPFWIQNARVLAADSGMPMALFPAVLLRAIVERFHLGSRKTRIFNHSINANSHCRTRHMSSWAAEIDVLSHKYDILIVQSSGNLQDSATVPSVGITEHLAAGRTYPEFLLESSSRVANPAQSFQALSVGSVAYQRYQALGWQSFASQSGQPSSFSRSGLGIWGVIKPEVVEFGGDFLRTPGNNPTVSYPTEARNCYPELIRSTLHGPGPAYDRDEIGTSFATPKVTHIAAHLQNILPDEPCLLYRALIVQSARWPEWARQAVDKTQVIRTLGYGIPDLERATTNTDYRTTFITSGESAIRARACDVYQVPIPDSLRRPGYEYDVLIEVTLSYVAQPRRTRRNCRRYLSTWVDWKSSNLGESISSFRARALKDETRDANAVQGTSIRWTLGIQADYGLVADVRRNAGTVQKDWATVKSSALPENFCVAVLGHPGWSKDPDSEARYALAVSFEIVGREIPIYDDLRVAVEELQAELSIEVEAEIEV